MTDRYRLEPSWATSWRELADQLTPIQIAALKRMERRFPDPTGPERDPENRSDDQTGSVEKPVLETARWLALANRSDEVKFSHVDLPPDACWVGPWTDHKLGVLYREFRLPKDLRYVRGRQYPDGRCERWIVSGSTSDMGPADSRELATKLDQAADYVDLERGEPARQRRRWFKW